MTYSLDFRQKVFSVKQQHELTFEQTSQRFDIPIRTLFRWQRQLEPCMTRNKPATKIDMIALAKHIQTHPDSYLWERALHFGVTAPAIHLALKRLGVSYKKNLEAPQGKRIGTYQLPENNKPL